MNDVLLFVAIIANALASGFFVGILLDDPKHPPYWILLCLNVALLVMNIVRALFAMNILN